MPPGWLLWERRAASPPWLHDYFRECERELAATQEFLARIEGGLGAASRGSDSP